MPLDVIHREIITTNINNNENIKGIKIPNNKKEIKISQYGDDSNILLTNEESIQHAITFFQKLKIASGSTINLEKTKILPTNTDQTSYIQKKYKTHYNTKPTPIRKNSWNFYFRKYK